MYNLEKRRKETVKRYKENFDFFKELWDFYKKYALVVDRSEEYYENLVKEAGEMSAKYSIKDPKRRIIIAIIQEISNEETAWKEAGI